MNNNPDHDIVYVDEHGKTWQHMGKGLFQELDQATLDLVPALIVKQGEYYVDGAAKGIFGLCRIKNRVILPKPKKLETWL